jgi:phosphoenolpyruvate phosphomutase
VGLLEIGEDLAPEKIQGVWMGFLKVSAEGSRFLRDLLARIAADDEALRSMNMVGLIREVIRAGKDVRVVYTTGHWVSIDSVEDVLAAGSFL